jgi:Plasmid encoded RepA protein
MGTVHDLLGAKGKQGALEAGLDRGVVEAASLYMGDENSALNFVYSGWAQCALPHRRLADDQPWELTVEKIRLVVEPGRRPKGGDGPLEFLGVPFGSHARLILLYLQTEALRTGSREVELGRSLRDWLGRIGVSVGGRTGKLVKDQAERISRCRLTFHIQGGKGAGLINQSIVDRALFIEDESEGQSRLSLETAKLSEGFFEQLRKHPIPLEEAAIKAINNNPAALDCYIWLAYRLHVLTAPKLVTWKALKGQFGTAYREAYHFKNKWTQTLAMACAVYPDAKVDVVDEGIILKPSRPPVTPRLIAIR